MQQAIQWTIIFPILLQLLQALLLLIVAIAVLRQRKLLAEPIAGMDYARIIFSAGLLLGVLLIASGSSTSMFRAFKSANDSSWTELLFAFAKFFAVSFAATFLYIGVTFLAAKAVDSRNNDDNIMAGNIPSGILAGVIAIGLAIVVNSIAAPLYEWLTPVYLNFR